MTLQPDAQGSTLKLDILIVWARDRRWLSATTVRRRLHVDGGEAERIIQDLVLAGALHPRPEGTVYRVRYPRPRSANHIYTN